MPNQIELKDAEQDQEIALLKHRVEQLEKDDDSDMVNELRERIRKLEKWVWGAGAVISAAVTILGLAMAADAGTLEKEEMTVGVLTQKIRQYEAEKKRTPVEDVLKNALKEWELWQQ
tara:strand:+ start:180 stop:530 length:351 start_codon:yes stop_codon:yes gene_type:complete